MKNEEYNMDPPSYWDKLPRDPLSLIAKFLEENPFDVLHVRAVCHSWRVAVAPPKRNLPLLMHCIIGSRQNPIQCTYHLYQSSIYVVKEPRTNASCLVEVSHEKFDQKLIPLTPYWTTTWIDTGFSGKCMNLLNFSITEIYRSFTFRWVSAKSSNNEDLSWQEIVSRVYETGEANDDDVNMTKLLCFDTLKSELSSNFDSNQSFLVIDKEMCLTPLTLGVDINILPRINEKTKYRNILTYKGEFYCLDVKGYVSIIEDFSIEVSRVVFEPPFLGIWYLVKSQGALFLVGRDIEAFRSELNYEAYCDMYIKQPGAGDISVDFKIYKLDETDPHRSWSQVTHIGDLVFFLGFGCSYAISASDFAHIEGNRIIFSDELGDRYPDITNDEDDGSGDLDVAVKIYNIEDGSTASLELYPAYCNICQASPTWFNSDPY